MQKYFIICNLIVCLIFETDGIFVLIDVPFQTSCANNIREVTALG